MQKEHNQHNKKKEKTFLSHLFHCPGQLKTLSRVDIKLTTSFVITTLERTERELELELEREREIERDNNEVSSESFRQRRFEKALM